MAETLRERAERLARKTTRRAAPEAVLEDPARDRGTLISIGLARLTEDEFAALTAMLRERASTSKALQSIEYANHPAMVRNWARATAYEEVIAELRSAREGADDA